MLSGRWHASHFCWKIGATSFVNVGVFGASAAAAGSAATIKPLNASAIETRNIIGSFQPTTAVAADTPDRRQALNSNGHYREDCTDEHVSFCHVCHGSTLDHKTFEIWRNLPAGGEPTVPAISPAGDERGGPRCILYTYVATQDRFRRVDVARPGQGPPLPHARSAAAATDAERHRAEHPSGTRRGLE